MDLKVLTSSITEPVTKAEVKIELGYPAAGTTHDALIDSLITSSRMWLESRTGRSFVSKSYQAYFDKDDEIDGWYELPLQPVLASPAIAVTVMGTVTTFQQRGLNKVFIRPDNVIGTISVGALGITYYMNVVFQAGELNIMANEIIRRIAVHLFTQKDDGVGVRVSVARLPFQTTQLINQFESY